MADREAEYAVPTCPAASEEVLITSVGGGATATVKEKDLVVFCCATPESATCTVMEKLPEAVGVPVIAPVDAVRVKPEGRAPDVMDHV